MTKNKQFLKKLAKQIRNHKPAKQIQSKGLDSLTVRGKSYLVVRVIDIIELEKLVSTNVFPVLEKAGVVRQYMLRSPDNYHHRVFEHRDGTFGLVIPIGTKHFDPPEFTDEQKAKFKERMAKYKSKEQPATVVEAIAVLNQEQQNERKQNGNINEKTLSQEINQRRRKSGPANLQIIPKKASPDNQEANRRFSFAERRRQTQGK